MKNIVIKLTLGHYKTNGLSLHGLPQDLGFVMKKMKPFTSSTNPRNTCTIIVYDDQHRDFNDFGAPPWTSQRRTLARDGQPERTETFFQTKPMELLKQFDQFATVSLRHAIPKIRYQESAAQLRAIYLPFDQGLTHQMNTRLKFLDELQNPLGDPTKDDRYTTFNPDAPFPEEGTVIGGERVRWMLEFQPVAFHKAREEVEKKAREEAEEQMLANRHARMEYARFCRGKKAGGLIGGGRKGKK